MGAKWEPISGVHRLEGPREFGVIGRQHVGVDAESNAYVRVTKALGHGLDRVTSGQQRRGVGVAQVVEPQLGQAGPRQDRLE